MFCFSTIRVRLILLVIALLLPVTVVTYWMVDQNRKLQIEQSNAQLLSDARQARADLQSDIRTLLLATSMLDFVPAVRQSLQPECTNVLVKFLENPDYLGAVTLDQQGNSLCNGLSLPNANKSISYADRDYFSKALKSGKPVVGKPLFGRLTKKAALPVAVPIKTPNGETTGMIATSLDLGSFGKRFIESRAFTGTVFLIWDRDGHLLYRYPDAEALAGNRFQQSPLVAIAAKGALGEGVVQTIGFDNMQRVVGFAELLEYRDSGVFVGISVPAEQLFSAANRMVHRAVIGLVLMLVVSIAAAWLIGRNLIWRPVQQLTHAARQLATGDYSARVGMKNGRSEISLLSKVFDQMAQAAQHDRVELKNINAQLEQKVLERTQRLQASEEKFRGVLESAADGVVIINRQGIIIVVNTALERLFGYSRQELLGQNLEILVPHDYRQTHMQQRRGYCEAPVARTMGTRGAVKGLRKDGSVFFAGVSLSPVDSSEDGWTTAVVRDISAAIAADSELRRLNRTLLVLSQCNEALVRAADESELLEAICRTAVEYGGYQLAWVGFALGDEMRSVLPVSSHGGHSDYIENLCISWADVERGRGPTGTAIREGRTIIAHQLETDCGFAPWQDAAQQQGFKCSVALPLKTKDGVLGALNLYSSDEGAFTSDEIQLLEKLADDLAYGINNLRESARRAGAEFQLDYQANFDPLTGLTNRTLLKDRLQQALVQAQRNERRLAVVLLDLDRFKAVNESLGMVRGDQLLKAIGQRLVSALREGDTVARLSVDEFCVLMTDLANAGDAANLTHKLLKVVATPITIDQHEVFLSASAGISLFPKDGDDADLLLAHATSAMQSAKSLGGNTFHFYAPEMNQRVATRLALDGALRRSLERSELVLHYQPVVDLMSGEILGAEALIRWPHPEMGMVSPADFIPMAEETGVIVPLGTWVVNQACHQMRLWLDAGLEVPQIAVNLSARQFRENDLLEMIRTSLNCSDLPASMLALEITESTIMVDVEQALKTLQGLKSMGLQLSLDDFGTGYSSLSYLKRFSADRLKIDRSFVRDITSDADDAAICKAVIALAHTMKMKVIAEGVETEGQMQYLRRQLCDEMQGYYFSRPLPAHEFAELLRNGCKLDVAGTKAFTTLPTLLIVDDEENVLSALKRLLRKGGYRILTATSAAQALDLLALNQIQVILSDQRMPQMSGTEFFSRVKEIYPNTVRIVLSGYTELDSVTETVNQGSIYRFFTKPWNDAQLQEEVKQAFIYHAKTFSTG